MATTVAMAMAVAMKVAMAVVASRGGGIATWIVINGAPRPSIDHAETHLRSRW